MEKTEEDLKDVVVRLRSERNWSQEVLAEKAKLSTQAIKHIERGRRGQNMTIDTARKLAGSFGMTISEFIGEKRAPEFIKEEEKPIKMSEVSRMIVSVPDEVYSLAAQLNGLPKSEINKLWKDIIMTLDIAVKQKQVRGL